MISKAAIERILGIESDTDLQPEQMASKLIFTFFPYDQNKIDRDVLVFHDLLQAALLELRIKIIPYNEALETVPANLIVKRFIKICVNNLLYVCLEIFKRNHSYYHIHPGALLNLVKRKRIRRGITIIALGENKTSILPIDYTSSFTQNSIITVLKCPSDIDEKSNFSKHFDTAMSVFSYHMTQIAILVKEDRFIIYNFNASHPVYPLHHNFKENILKALIPKVAAPIKPPHLKDFIVEPETFDIDSEFYRNLTDDLVIGGKEFDKTELFPSGKKVDDLPFRSGFYRWIGRLHLDHRSGMSYGFLAKQMPCAPVELKSFSEHAVELLKIKQDKDYFILENKLHIIVEISSGKHYLRVPPVWVLTQRSGSDKTRIDIHRDVLLLGLVDGKMYLRTPKGNKLRKDYRPSFDTKVILAHAVGNAIIASILSHISKSTGELQKFAEQLTKNGAGIVHWHGYIQHQLIPSGWHVHGYNNPHVACSTAQSAIYALAGKLDVFEKSLNSKILYLGDVHIEPHHGTNINFTSIRTLAEFLNTTPNVSELGNKYLKSDL